jgi:hypothetical protein
MSPGLALFENLRWPPLEATPPRPKEQDVPAETPKNTLENAGPSAVQASARHLQHSRTAPSEIVIPLSMMDGKNGPQIIDSCLCYTLNNRYNLYTHDRNRCGSEIPPGLSGY